MSIYDFDNDFSHYEADGTIEHNYGYGWTG